MRMEPTNEQYLPDLLAGPGRLLVEESEAACTAASFGSVDDGRVPILHSKG